MSAGLYIEPASAYRSGNHQSSECEHDDGEETAHCGCGGQHLVGRG